MLEYYVLIYQLKFIDKYSWGEKNEENIISNFSGYFKLFKFG